MCHEFHSSSNPYGKGKLKLRSQKGMHCYAKLTVQVELLFLYTQMKPLLKDRFGNLNKKAHLK
jgi:hypothetical protein